LTEEKGIAQEEKGVEEGEEEGGWGRERKNKIMERKGNRLRVLSIPVWGTAGMGVKRERREQKKEDEATCFRQLRGIKE